MLDMKVKIRTLLNKGLDELDDRAVQVVVNRYGLYGKEKRTLASLGESYSLTRERVRQIESNALKHLREAIKEEEEATVFLDLIQDYLDKLGNIRRYDLLVRDLRTLCGVRYQESVFAKEVYLFARVMGEPEIVEESDYWHNHWHNDESSYKLATSVINHLSKFKEEDFKKFLISATRKFELPESIIVNYLSVSKYFGVGPYGDLGHKNWIHVNPRTVRDKSYLVLKKAEGPMHFKEIAKLVNQIDEKRAAHCATVHNELIKDPRFVLVGRGTYALRDYLKK